MAKRRRNWDWPRISGGFVLLFAPARADARFARTKGDYVPMPAGHPREHEPGVCGAVHVLLCPGAGRALGDLRVHRGRAVPANMQKYALEGGEALAGQAALQDTMGDLIVDFIGALAIAIAGYLSLKRGKGNRSTRPERHKRRARANCPCPPLVLPSALQHLARALLGDRVDQGADAAARLAVLLLQHGPVLVQKGDDVAPVVGHGELEPAVQVLQA